MRAQSKYTDEKVADNNHQKEQKNALDKNSPYHLKTCYDVHVLPLKIDKLKYLESPSGDKSNHDLIIEIISNENKPLLLKDYSCNQITFYINERLENAFFIYDMVMNKTKSVHLTLENRETKKLVSFS